MKKQNLLLSFSFLIVSTYSFSQDNTLPPAGNVGVGTLNPSTRLHVNGAMRVDSSVVVNDSIRVNKDVRVMEKLYVEGTSYLNGNIIGGSNFSLLGNATIEGNALINGNFNLPNLTNVGTNAISNGDFSFLVTNPNGLTKRTSYDDILIELKGAIYAPPPNPVAICELVGYTNNPTWFNGPNKIYSPCPDVNVGLSTENPLFKLDVRGDGYFSRAMGVGIYPQSDAQFTTKSIRTNGLVVDHNPSVDYGYTIKAIVHDELVKGIGVYSQTYNKDIFSVYANGKVVVSNSTEKILQLDPNGNLQVRKVQVNLNSWPDYVFKNDYKLMPLTEVKEFITKNGHLPGVPTEYDIISKGMDVGEMSKILVEKIEVLTLYLLEQQDEIKDLKKELMEIKNTH